MEITTVGIHLAKSIFQVHAVDAADSVAAAAAGAGAIMLTGDNARTAQAVASALRHRGPGRAPAGGRAAHRARAAGRGRRRGEGRR